MDRILFIAMLIIISSANCLAQQGIFINEIMASNQSIIQDRKGGFDDWIELYNPEKKPIDLNGYYLSDDAENLQKFKISIHSQLDPGGYLIIWMDEEPADGRLHANFKLSKKGEQLFLVHKDGQTIIDEVRFGAQLFDVSYQRFPNGGNHWGYCLKPSPGKSNNKLRTKEVITQPPSFSQTGGFYSDKMELNLSTTIDADIFYTLDGSDPILGKSTTYTDPIIIDSHTVVKAQSILPERLPSPVITHTFFVLEKRSLPVVSLSTHPDNLWDPVDGIYGVRGARNSLNKGKKWTKPAHFEFFLSSGEKVVDTDLDMEIAGGATRYYAKKSFAITTKNKYGNSVIKYPFFDKAIDQYKSLLLRADSGGGGHYSNEMIYGINKALGRPVVMQAYQPVALFLNGQYWGLYNLMERKGEDFIRNNFHCKNDVDIITPKMEVKAGDLQQFEVLVDFFRENDFSKDEVFEKVCALIDMDNYLDHTVYNLFYNKFDYNLNVRFWRPKTLDGQWRLITYDFDYFEPLTGSNQPDLLSLFQTSRKDFAYEFTGTLLTNKFFVNLLANRTADYLNSALKPDHLKRIIFDNENIIAHELAKDCERWSASYNLGCQQRAEAFDTFLKNIEQQGIQLFTHLDTSLNLGGPGKVEIKASPINAGSVRVNAIMVDRFPWNGTYFQGVPVEIEAIADPGYKFEGWSDKKMGANPKVSLQVSNKKKSLVAVFSKKD